mgnify:FL=1
MKPVEGVDAIVLSLCSEEGTEGRGGDPVRDARAGSTELLLDGRRSGLLGTVVAEHPSDLIHVVGYPWIGSGEFDVPFEPLLALGICLDRLPVQLTASCRCRVRLADRSSSAGRSVGHSGVRMSTVGSTGTWKTVDPVLAKAGCGLQRRVGVEQHGHVLLTYIAPSVRPQDVGPGLRRGSTSRRTFGAGRRITWRIEPVCTRSAVTSRTRRRRPTPTDRPRRQAAPAASHVQPTGIRRLWSR